MELQVAAIKMQANRNETGEALTDALQEYIRNGELEGIVLPSWMDVGQPWNILDANGVCMEHLKTSVEGTVEENVTLHGPVVVEKGDAVLSVRGPARAVLTGERLALNFLMRMSGIATLTNDLLQRCRKVNPEVKVAATRKTTPGFREFEKRAVSLGGGDPHRFGLDDAILIKDNHIALAGGVREALRKAKAASFTKKIEVEVENEKDALVAAEEGADIVMLDNFEPEEGARVAELVRGRCPGVVIEVSGGVRPDNIEQFASYADIISLGWLTHSVRSVDFSMNVSGE